MNQPASSSFKHILSTEENLDKASVRKTSTILSFSLRSGKSKKSERDADLKTVRTPWRKTEGDRPKKIKGWDPKRRKSSRESRKEKVNLDLIEGRRDASHSFTSPNIKMLTPCNRKFSGALSTTTGKNCILKDSFPISGTWEALVDYSMNQNCTDLLMKCVIGFRFYISTQEFLAIIGEYIQREESDKYNSIIRNTMSYWIAVSPEDLHDVDVSLFEEYFGSKIIPRSIPTEYRNEETIRDYLSLTQNLNVLSLKLCHLDQQVINRTSCRLLFQEPEYISQHTNIITRWVIQEILTTPGTRERSKKISIFISLANTLCAVSNYNSLFAIVNGLTLFTVSRLKSTWKKVSSKKMKVLSLLESMCSPTSNFGSLQSLAHESTSDRMIPFLLPSLVNISRLREIIDLDEDSNMVPVSKLKAYQKIFNNITKYTRDIPPNEQILVTDTSLSFEILDELSLSIEP